MQTSIDKDSWLSFERRNWVALVVVAGMGGYALGNGHTTSSAIDHVSMQLGDTKAQVHKLQTTEIPKLKAIVNCEHARADTNELLAEKAIVGKKPSPDDIAEDCPHPK